MIQELPQISHIYLKADGTGDYATIQEAVSAVPDHNSAQVVIHLQPGVYRETVEISGDKPHISLQGEGSGPEETEIVYDNHAGTKQPNGDITGTFRSGTVSIYSNYFTARNLTFKNDFDGVSGGRQALAVYASGEQMEFENCRFISLQDTLYAKDGSQYYENCYIEGDVDFVFGGARAYFENCDLYAINVNPEDTERKAYLTAPSTPVSQKYGLVFHKCRVDSNCAAGKVYLGRPWHPGSDPYAVGNCVFMECELSDCIAEEGWKPEMGGFLSKNARLYEYKNSGSSALVNEARRQLSDEEAADYSIEKVLFWK